MAKVSNLFPVPKNVVDVREDRQKYDGLDRNVQELEPAETIEGRGRDYPITPTDFQVVSQRIRHLSDGTSVADVVINFPGDVNGTNYEVRVYKV